ncbi:MAG: hypothetical protein WAL88_06345 [Nitrosotalea sp.]
MKKSVIVILIISIVGIGILIFIVHLFAIPYIPQEHFQLHCLQHEMESVPHMKWNCYYFTR